MNEMWRGNSTKTAPF
jgi:hypothetical protein